MLARCVCLRPLDRARSCSGSRAGHVPRAPCATVLCCTPSACVLSSVPALPSPCSPQSLLSSVPDMKPASWDGPSRHVVYALAWVVFLVLVNALRQQDLAPKAVWDPYEIIGVPEVGPQVDARPPPAARAPQHKLRPNAIMHRMPTRKRSSRRTALSASSGTRTRTRATRSRLRNASSRSPRPTKRA